MPFSVASAELSTVRKREAAGFSIMTVKFFTITVVSFILLCDSGRV